MKVLEKLNALDEKVLPTRKDGWRAQAVRYWWLDVVSAVTFAAIYLQFGPDSRTGALLLVAPGISLFRAGYLYNERMRQLGRRPRWWISPHE